MPELPEVETVKRSIAPYLINKTLLGAVIRFPRLRWPIPPDLAQIITQQPILSVWRRAKYIIIELPTGAILLHLGMSGSLRILTRPQPAEKHDHVDLLLNNDITLRLRDPRRFGALLWQPGAALDHPLLTQLGPEPFSSDFNADYLLTQFKNKNIPIKLALMNHFIVVGIGNIYANEALFRAGILPQRIVKTLTRLEVTQLISEIKAVLTAAIAAGGSTLRDFVDSDGNAGCFQQSYFVYQRREQICHHCGDLIQHQVMQGRATFFCRVCQK